MYTTVLQENLYRALSDLLAAKDAFGKRILSKNPRFPILSHVLIRTEEDRLALYATSLEETKCLEVPARVGDTFSICAPAHILREWVGLAGQTIKMKGAGKCLTLTTEGLGKTVCHLVCIPADEFPSIEQAGDLQKPDALTRAMLAARGKDEACPELMRPLYFGGKMVVTDTRRMHVIPSNLPDQENELRQQIETLWENAAKSDYAAVVEVEALAKACATFKSLAREGASLRFRCNGSILLEADCGYTGVSRMEVPVKSSAGTEVEFNLPYQQVREALTLMTAGLPKSTKKNPVTHTVVIRHADPDTPILFENEGRQAYIMPIAA